MEEMAEALANVWRMVFNAAPGASKVFRFGDITVTLQRDQPKDFIPGENLAGVKEYAEEAVSA